MIPATLDQSPKSSLLEWLTVRARWLVPCAILLHAALWTILPAVVNLSLPLDVIEALLWGREWRMGYDKHPPLSAWAAEVAAIMGGRSDLAIYALSQVCVAIAALAMWRLARDILDEGRAALATLCLLVGVYYMNFTSPEFNVNVLQLPLWALLFLCFWRAVRSPGRLALLAWAGVGVWFGLAMLTKYLAAFALPPLAIFVFFTPTGRRALRTRGPYIAGAVAAAVFLPHFLWMLDTDFVTLTYGMRRASGGEAAWIDHLRYPLKFVAAQTIASAATLVVLFFSGAWFSGPKNPAHASVEPRDARLFVWLIAVGPVLTMAAYSAVTGARLRSMWGTSMVIGIPLLLTMLARFDARPARIRGFVASWIGLMVLALGAYFADNAAGPGLAHDAKRTNFPGEELASNIERAWHDRHGWGLPIVIGDEWYGGQVSWYGPSRASVYIDGTTERTFWLDDDDVRARGAMVVWKLGMADDPEHRDSSFVDGLRERFPSLVELDPVVVNPRQRGPFAGEIEGTGEILGRAYIPPSEGLAR